MCTMSRSVDDIWASLKAASAAKMTQRRSNLPKFDKTCPPLEQDGGDGRTGNITCGHQSTDSAGNLTLPADGHLSLRVINSLTDADRSIRKQAIDSVNRVLSPATMAEMQIEELRKLCEGPLIPGLIKMLSDPMDSCREKAFAVLCCCASRLPDTPGLLVSILDAVKERMGIGQQATVEASEETRLAIARFTATSLTVNAPKHPSCFTEDVAAVLIRCLEDSFHETKKAACSGISALSQNRLSNTLLLQLLVPLVGLFHHQHSRVRSAALDALSALLQNNLVSSDVMSATVVPALKGLALDRSSTIRAQTFAVTASWMGSHDAGCLAAPCSQPRRYARHLLPLLLLGLTDDSPAIASKSLPYVEGVGVAYYSEDGAAANAKSILSTIPPQPGLEDSSPHTRPESDDSVAAAALSLPPPFDRRAAIEARLMVQEELAAILPPVLGEIREWTIALRSIASRSLYSIMVLSEGAVGPHLSTLLPALCNAVGDEDESIALHIVHCVHVVGAFCEVRPSPDQVTMCWTMAIWFAYFSSVVFDSSIPTIICDILSLRESAFSKI
jgi:hypothetical protein